MPPDGYVLLGTSESDSPEPGLPGSFIPHWSSRASSWTGPPEPRTGPLGCGWVIRCYTIHHPFDKGFWVLVQLNVDSADDKTPFIGFCS